MHALILSKNTLQSKVKDAPLLSLLTLKQSLDDSDLSQFAVKLVVITLTFFVFCESYVYFQFA